MNLRPTGARVIIRPVEGPTKRGSIFIPENARDVSIQGDILAVGPEVTMLYEGDRVLYGKYSGAEIPFENETFIICHESDILAVVGEAEVTV